MHYLNTTLIGVSASELPLNAVNGDFVRPYMRVCIKMHSPTYRKCANALPHLFQRLAHARPTMLCIPLILN